MQIKEGLGWKAGYNEKKGVYGAEIMFQGSWELYEISADVYSRLYPAMASDEAEKLIVTGRRLYFHVNDRCGPPYTVVLDDDYAVYCPWMGPAKGAVWDEDLTDAAVELFDSEKQNREQRRKKRAQRKKKTE